VEGFITGLHRSPYHGFSVEFSQHRPYMPGDALKNIDWRVWGRTDKFFVKQYQEETNLKAYIILDSSASMGYTSGKVSKLQYGAYLSAALTYLLLKQRDAVGLVTFDRQIRTLIPPRSFPGYLNRILAELEHVQPGGETIIGENLHLIAERLKRRGLVIIISDLLSEEGEILSGLKHFRHNGHEAIVFHLLDPQERNFNFHGNIRFKDLETKDKLPTAPDHLREIYRREFEGWLKGLEDGCRDNRIDYARFDTQEPFDFALSRFLNKRKAVK
jgi:uncharacterized protein (DUF58 family)